MINTGRQLDFDFGETHITLSGNGILGGEISLYPKESLSKKVWALYRLDDNGNEFEMLKFYNNNKALRKTCEYKKKKHKQTYFVRRIE